MSEKIKVTSDEAELRDFIIGNLDWLATADRDIAAKWLDDAIATHTRCEGKTAEEWARLQSQTAFVVSEVNLRAEAAEAKVKELEAKLDAAIAEAKREAQPARCERHACVVPSLNSICEICDHEEAVAYAVSRTKDKCADAAEAALQAAPDYEAMHTMVRAAIMQVGNDQAHLRVGERKP